MEKSLRSVVKRLRDSLSADRQARLHYIPPPLASSGIPLGMTKVLLISYFPTRFDREARRATYNLRQLWQKNRENATIGLYNNSEQRTASKKHYARRA